MKRSDFSYQLPPELIAQAPLPERSASRLLDGSAAVPADRVFRDLPQLLQPGDLLGTGTLSGPSLAQAAALIELTAGGKHPITLPNGETRTWLEDGDTIILRGHCQAEHAARIGFGECRGTVLPAREV